MPEQFSEEPKTYEIKASEYDQYEDSYAYKLFRESEEHKRWIESDKYKEWVASEEYEKHKAELWKDLDDVGKEKPIGCLPIDTITDVLGKNIKEIVKQLAAKGLEVRIFRNEWASNNGSFYVYDKVALQNLLDENQQVLLDANWPTIADDFIVNIETMSVEKGTPLDRLIAKTYADKYRYPD